MGMLGSLGSLNVLLSADTTQFTSAMDKAAFMAERDLQRISSKAKLNGAVMATALTAAASAFAVSMKRILDDADNLGKMSQKIGVSVESLSAFRFAADLAGTEFETMTKGLAKFSRAAADASNGLDTAARPFRQLNIEFEKSNGGLRDVESMLLDVADRFSIMADGAKKAALAQELFGRSGVELIPFLNQGRQGIEEIRKEAERLGIVFDDKTARSAENFNDNMTRLANVSRGALIGIASGLVPVLERLSEAIQSASVNTEMFSKAGKMLAFDLSMMISSGQLLITVFDSIVKTLGAAGAQIALILTAQFSAAAQVGRDYAVDMQTSWTSAIDGIKKNFDSLSGSAAESSQKTRDSMSGPMFEFTSDMEDSMKRIQKLGDGVGNAFGKALDNAALEGMKFKDVMLGLLKDIEAAIFKTMISNRIADSISTGINAFFSPNTPAATKTVSVTASRHGNMFNNGNVVPFANGGVISGPMTWPMSGGRRGLAGEAGNEVIAPLFRSSSGDMGVKSVAPRVEVNVYAPEGSSVRQESKMEGDREQINIMIDEAVAGNISRPGSKTHRSMKNTFGASPVLTRR